MLSMKWVKRIFLSVCILLCISLIALYFGAPFLNDFQDEGELALPGLADKVTVQRDEKGMAYIKAESIEDALMAQGFVTAQDRLFQMQVTRLLTQGRISELAGPDARNLDIRMRTIGLHRMAKKQAAMLDDETRQFFKQYVNGINAFIDNCPEEIHLEFKLAGIEPEKWEIEDSLCILYYMGYSTAANLDTEIVSQMLLETLGYEQTLEIMPLNFNADDPEDTGSIILPDKEALAADRMDISSLLAFTGPRTLRGGSNNWVVSSKHAPGKFPMLAGDPHLDTRILPGVWYPIGLTCPGIHATGANIAGLPGIAIGRTDHIAIAMTNSYGDMQDLYIETVDPKNPDNYLEGEKSIPFISIKEVLKIKNKDVPEGFTKEAVTIRATKRGPVISNVLPDLKTSKVVSLRFAPAESMEPAIGLTGILSAQNVYQLEEHLKHVSMICLNWVFADTSGNIGHRASGKIPVRHNGDGTFPHVVKSGEDNWHGYIPADEMPGTLNPNKNWLGTSNHKTVRNDYPYYYSSFAAPSFRYRRVRELMISFDKKTANDFFEFQKDTKNLMAANIAPVMTQILLAHEETRPLGYILSQWNFRDAADQTAPTIFQTVYSLFAKKVFTDDLGPEKAGIFLGNWYFWQEKLQQMVLKGQSAWFDDITTPETETMEDLFVAAGREATAQLSEKLGKDPSKWLWGKIHTIELVSPLRRSGIGTSLLGSGALPMGGSGETLNRANYDFNDPFKVTFSVALRMVADLSDTDKVIAIMPGGVTGRLFHPHQKDQISPFMKGQKRYWWFSEAALKDHTESTLILSP